MDIIYFLVPISLILILVAVIIFFWAVHHKQFEDLDQAAHQILFDDKERRND